MSDEVLVINERVRIPLADLTFAATRSSGPGGQHVNKTESAIELAFDLAGSPYLTDVEKRLAGERLPGYVDAAGVLRITAQSERSQSRNKDAAVERFVQLLRAALLVPRRRRPTRPPRGAAERRLESKRRTSAIKRARKRGDDG